MTKYRATDGTNHTDWHSTATAAILDGFTTFGVDISNWHIELLGGGVMEV